MPKAVTASKHQPTPVERFVGGEVRVLAAVPLAISNAIQGDCYEVALPDDEAREDKGMLSLYPIDDNKFCLEISYLQLSDASSSNGSICTLRFLPAFFDQYPAETLMANQPFRFDQSTQIPFAVCALSRSLVDKLQTETVATPFIKSLERTSAAMHLLRRALECITTPFEACQVPACRFLAYESEREKIQDARRIIEQNIDQPHTIRELARKVAMNECYLKKGFKTVTGRTIHEYQQELRIAKAKELLQQGLSVTDVANTLGYSSISHFSTAFKRVTGLKPCELLK